MSYGCEAAASGLGRHVLLPSGPFPRPCQVAGDFVEPWLFVVRRLAPSQHVRMESGGGGPWSSEAGFSPHTALRSHGNRCTLVVHPI